MIDIFLRPFQPYRNMYPARQRGVLLFRYHQPTDDDSQSQARQF